MMRKILFILFIASTVVMLAACSGKDGSPGEDGAPGIDGIDGVDGEDGKDGKDGSNGLSSYELYVEEFPGYTDEVDQWLVDLATGNLVLNLTVVLPNSTEEFIFMKGQPFSDLTYTEIYEDADFENPVNDNYVMESRTVYVKDDQYKDYYGLYGGGHEIS